MKNQTHHATKQTEHESIHHQSNNFAQAARGKISIRRVDNETVNETGYQQRSNSVSISGITAKSIELRSIHRTTGGTERNNSGAAHSETFGNKDWPNVHSSSQSAPENISLAPVLVKTLLHNTTQYNDNISVADNTSDSPHGVQIVISNRTIKASQHNERSKIVEHSPSGTVASANVTIVTAYFRLNSKHDISSYNEWMRLMLSLQDAMVVYTTADLVQQIQSHRTHALNRTVIIPMLLEQLPVATMFSTAFWENQLAIDPERKHHKSYQLFWIWLSKSWFMTDAISRNDFQSSLFVWSDIGCFRGDGYKGRTLVQHPELVPRHAILNVAHSDFNPPNELFWNDKFAFGGKHFYQAGALAVGYWDTWQLFHKFFVETVEGFAKRNMFMGEDQVVLQSTCRQHPTLCAYVHPAEIVGVRLWERKKKRSRLKDLEHICWFGLQHVLHHGGNYSLWYHPPLTKDEEEQVHHLASRHNVTRT